MEQTADTALTAESMSRRRHARFAWPAAALAAALLALLLTAVLRPATANPLTAPNRPAPDFTLPLFGGGTLRLASLRGKTVVVNFWWSDCQPCIQEAPILERAWRAWRSRGVVFVGVDEIDGPNAPAARAFLRRYGVTYPNGWDPGDVDIQYGTTGQPETFFITPRGRVAYHYTLPFTDEQAMSRLIEEARA